MWSLTELKEEVEDVSEDDLAQREIRSLSLDETALIYKETSRKSIRLPVLSRF